jgi:uncharacterized protein YecE (DUF72 family)
MIFVGIGGWTYEPWRGTFYPPGLPQARELSYACSQLTSIEINGTFYRTQKPDSFRKWADEAPEGFVFSLKGPRYATNRTRLSEAGESIARFFDSGVTELGAKLGPILWQFAPTKKFDEEDFAGFLAFLPEEVDGRLVRHVVEVRHDSFRTAAFIALLRRHRVPVVYADGDFPAIADVTGDFVYARLQRSAAHQPAGYAPEALDQWVSRFEAWAAGGEPDDLPRVEPRLPSDRGRQRDCFVYFIAGAKVRAPAAAMAFLERLKRTGGLTRAGVEPGSDV